MVPIEIDPGYWRQPPPRCTEPGCNETAVYTQRCTNHVLEMRERKDPRIEVYDQIAERRERREHNAHGKAVLERLKESKAMLRRMRGGRDNGTAPAKAVST